MRSTVRTGPGPGPTGPCPGPIGPGPGPTGPVLGLTGPGPGSAGPGPAPIGPGLGPPLARVPGATIDKSPKRFVKYCKIFGKTELCSKGHVQNKNQKRHDKPETP